MEIVNVSQGTEEWLAHRANFFNASDAPAMMGVSPYKTRSALLNELATGSTAEVSPSQRALYDEGHRSEALYRPIAEQIIGEELYPVVGTEGWLSASFDGLTISEEDAYEHKMLNEDLRKAFADIATVAPEHQDAEAGRLLPMLYQVQMEQQCMIGKCRRVLFAASRWSHDGELLEGHYCWYYPNADLATKISLGWEQFNKDLAEFVPVVEDVKPLGRTMETLPALRVEVTGMVTASNLREFKDHALAVIGAINRDLKTDQDFADAEATVKWCGDVESKLEATKEHALSQTQSIDLLFKTIDDISAETRRVRLDLDKLVTKRKTEIKDGIVVDGRNAYAQHIADLKVETGGAWVQLNMPDFAAAVKGKRSMASMRDAVDTLLANAKIEADGSAKRIRANLALLDSDTVDYGFLFSDRLALATKQIEDLRLVITSRIDAHKAAEARKEAEQRERIRKEEAERLEREQRKAQEEEDALIASLWKQARRIEGDTLPYIDKAIHAYESIACDWENDPRPRVAEAVTAARKEMAGKWVAARDAAAALAAQPAPEPVVEPAPVPTPVPAPTPVRNVTALPTITAPSGRITAKPRATPRPSDAQIVFELSQCFHATTVEVVEWLRTFDFAAQAA